MTTSRFSRVFLALAVLLTWAPTRCGIVSVACAQSYARFAVPDTALGHVLEAGRSDYEATWNALLVAELRATLARADSSRRLATLAQAVARAEPGALGTHIAPDALALRRHWKRDQLLTRVAAAAAESLAAVARGARAYARADTLLHRALDAYRALGERRREAWVLGALGANALVAGSNGEAATYYDDALAAREAIGDSLMIGNTLNDLGQTYVQLRQPERAYAVLLRAAAIRDAQHRWGPLGNTLNFLGLALASLGRSDSAMTCYRRSLELTSAQGDSARTLVTVMNYGLFLVDQARIDEAIPVLERALELASSQGAVRQTADAEHNLGYLYRTAGHYAQALDHYDRAIASFAQLGDSANIASSSRGKALALINTGEIDAARRVLDEARAIADSSGDPVLRSKILSTQALAAEEAGDVSGARRLAARAFAAAEAGGDSAAVHDAAALQGFLAARVGEPGEVDRWLRRAIAAGAGLPTETHVNDLAALATARQLAGRLDEAEAGHRAALDLALASGLTNQAMMSLCCLGDVDERREHYAAALAHYGRAVAMAETLRTLQRTERKSIALFANRLFMFEAMIHLMGKLDRQYPDSAYAERAFEWAERARGRAFLDLVASSGAHGSTPALLGVRGTQSLLRSDREALLEYSVGDSSTSLWVIRKDRWKYFTLPPRAVLQSRIQVLRRGLASPNAADLEPTLRLAHSLYQQLVAPAESLLAGVDHIIVAPDGVLSLIPFEALLTRDARAGRPAARGDYLAERFAISYIPSASVLATLRGGEAASGIVAIGNPDFGAPDSSGSRTSPLAALPNTAAEIEMLRSLAAGRDITTLTGADACRSRVLSLAALSRAGIVHIATHGDVDEAEPEHSGLWLAPEPGEPGPSRIEVADILRLRLVASLVTLSACETGLGRLESGEGVVGLARAFMAAGARSVIVSLWPVNDRSTARLMARFYRRALDGRTSSAAALAIAKRELLANPETRAPFYWAPFILVGQSGIDSGVPVKRP